MESSHTGRYAIHFYVFQIIRVYAMNVDLLQTVKRRILQRPERFSAAQWAFARNATRVIRGDDAVPSGFKCCIAGHVLLEAAICDKRTLLRRGGFHSGDRLWTQAGQVLALTTDQRDELFFPSQWDKPYKQNYYLCAKEEEAEVAASYIDYFTRKHNPDAPRLDREDRPATYRAPEASRSETRESQPSSTADR